LADQPKDKKDKQFHPLIYGYLKRYQDDPNSRVFAPLAEAYRKAGLIDEAIEIAREGIRKHPNFAGGKVALARALFDQQRYEEVIQALQPIVQETPDNLVAQKLIAESALMLGRLAESLAAYKMYLYFSPQDAEVGKLVQELEKKAYEGGALVLQSETPRKIDFNEQPAAEAIESDPHWRHNQWVLKIEFLQDLLLKVERYRTQAG
jgi:tetratricopeptide (TPR) repeat protein